MLPQVLNTMIGIWLTAAPGALGYERPGSTNDHIIGPLVATFACIAIWEVTRPLRWVNLPLGMWLLAAPWLLNHPLEGRINSLLCGMAIAVFACLGGGITQRFGGGWSVLVGGTHPRDQSPDEPAR